MLLNDGVRGHPKVLKAGAEAAWLWAAAIDYCRDHLTDGVVPFDALRTLGNFKTPVVKLARRCVDAGLLESDERGFRVHDYLTHNDNRATVEQKKRKETERKAAYRASHSGGDTHGTVPQVSPGGPGDVPTGQGRDTHGTRAIAYPRVGVGTGIGSFGEGSGEPPDWPRDEWFERLLAVYPNKARTIVAQQEFVTAVRTEADAQACLDAVTRLVRTDWRGKSPEYVPQLWRFLQERRWTDPVAAEPERPGHPTVWTCPKCGFLHEGTRAQYAEGWCAGRDTRNPEGHKPVKFGPGGLKAFLAAPTIEAAKKIAGIDA